MSKILLRLFIIPQISGSEDGKVLREQISKVSKHLRVCTLSSDQFCQEVVPVEVLRRDEMILICRSIGNKIKLDDLSEFSNEIEPRERLHKKVKLEQCELKLIEHNKTNISSGGKITFIILTKQCAVELLPLVCLAEDRERFDPEGWTYRFDCTVKITKMISRNTCDDSPLTFTFREEVEYGKTFEVPLAVDGCNVTLLPNSKYTVQMQYSSSLYLYFYNSGTFYETNHMILHCLSYAPSNCLYYRPVKDE